MVDHFIRAHDGKYFPAANEAGATLMALGYAAASRKVGVASVTHGPGLVNTLTALVEGVKARTPMVLLCGDTAVVDVDHLQNVPQRDFIVATGAGFVQMRSPQTIAEDVATAFRRAAVEQRPVALNMPVDFMWLDVAYARPGLKVIADRPTVVRGTELDNAVGIIAAARHPLVLAGRGALHPNAREPLARLAARIGGVLATTLKARGLFRGDDFDLGVFGTLSTPVATDAIMQSDCIISFGAGLNAFTTSHGAFLKGKRIVEINAESRDLGKNCVPDAGLVGDPGQVAETIIEWLDIAEIPASGFRTEELRHRIASHSLEPVLFPEVGKEGKYVDIRKALLRLNAMLPSDRVVVADAGRFLPEVWRTFDVEDPRDFVDTVAFASIGLGFSQAVGASAAVRDENRLAVAVVGDGGFMLGGLAEFASAVLHKSNLIVIVCNDGGYGAEHIQFRRKGMDPSISLFDWPDLAPVAQALGGIGITVRNDDELESVAAAIANRDRPLLVDLRLNPDCIPEIPY